MADVTHDTHDTHGHAGHAHPAHLQHHFDTPAQQFDASKLGMWLFLATEVLFFSGLFVFYGVVRANHPDVFIAGHKHLDKTMGAINTIVLIASSFTMAMGVYYAQTSRRWPLVICLGLTWLGALAFMCVKYKEYSDKIEHGLLWGRHYTAFRHEDPHAPGGAAAHAAAGAAHEAGATSAPGHGAETPSSPAAHGEPAAGAPQTAHNAASAAPRHGAPESSPSSAETADAAAGGLLIEVSQIKPAADAPAGLRVVDPQADEHAADPDAQNVHLFFSIYFCMTGLHGIHVLAGMVVIGWILIGAIRGRYNSEYYTPVDLVGLYWHIVDLVWIYLFPMLYLI
jgi:cytochrome c oxidase subunit 3